MPLISVISRSEGVDSSEDCSTPQRSSSDSCINYNGDCESGNNAAFAPADLVSAFKVNEKSAKTTSNDRMQLSLDSKATVFNLSRNLSIYEVFFV